MPARRSLLASFIPAIVLAGLVHGATGRSLQQKASTPDPTSCLFDFERGEVPDCMRQAADGELLVSPQVLKLLNFDSYGLAPVWSATEGWMYVTRTGKIVISGVPSTDNWADSFHDGLVRVVRSKKYGFANRKGRIVISTNYDGAMNFEKGKAKVCNRCESKCVDHDCEHHVFAGGEWFQINTQGIVVARIRPDN
jgi:hypothetical protein